MIGRTLNINDPYKFQDEAEKMYVEHDIVPLLNQLEELSKQKKSGVRAW